MEIMPLRMASIIITKPQTVGISGKWHSGLLFLFYISFSKHHYFCNKKNTTLPARRGNNLSRFQIHMKAKGI